MKNLYQFTAFNHVMFAFLWTFIDDLWWLFVNAYFLGQILKIVRGCKLRPETHIFFFFFFFFFLLWLLRLKACARKKSVIKLKNKVREHFLIFCCVVVEFMQ